MDYAFLKHDNDLNQFLYLEMGQVLKKEQYIWVCVATKLRKGKTKLLGFANPAMLVM